MLIKNLLKFVSEGPSFNKLLFLVMAWRWTGDKSLTESMITKSTWLLASLDCHDSEGNAPQCKCILSWASRKLTWTSGILYRTYEGHLFMGECPQNLVSHTAWFKCSASEYFLVKDDWRWAKFSCKSSINFLSLCCYNGCCLLLSIMLTNIGSHFTNSWWADNLNLMKIDSTKRKEY